MMDGSFKTKKTRDTRASLRGYHALKWMADTVDDWNQQEKAEKSCLTTLSW